MRNFIAFLLVFSSLSLVASSADSLDKIIKTGSEPERYNTLKLVLGNYISYQRTVGDTSHAEMATKYFRLMQKMAGKDSNRLIEYNLYQGWFLVKYNLLSSFENIRNAIKAAREAKNTRLIAESYLTAGMLMESELDYFLGLQYYFAAINQFKLLKDEEKLAFCYNKVGNLLVIYVQYDRALEYLEKGAKLFLKHESYHQYSHCMERISALHLRTGEFEKALNTLSAMETVLKNQPHKSALIKAYTSFAAYYQSSQEFDECGKYLGKAYSLVPFLKGNTTYRVIPYLGFANMYIATGEFKKAFQYLNFCTQLEEKITIKNRECIALQQEIYLAYYTYYISQGNAEKASEYMAKSSQINIDLNNLLVERITALVNVFEAEKEENYTIANLQTLNEQQRLINQRQNTKLNYLIIFAALLLFVLAAIYYRYRERQKIAKYLEYQVETRTQELKAQSHEKTLMLKEIHHRVKNNLQLISSFLNLQKHYATDKPTEQIISETQERVRCMAIIHEKLYSAQSLSNLDTKAYLSEIAHFVYQSYASTAVNVNIHLNIAQAHLSLDKMIPCGLIINELLSNCFKYAFKEKQEGDIWVDYTVDNEYHKLIIRDNGIGLPNDFSVEKLNSLGMNIVIGLVEQLDGHMRMESKNGTYFEILFT